MGANDLLISSNKTIPIDFSRGSILIGDAKAEWTADAAEK